MPTRRRVDICLCGQPVVLHFSANGRKLDCAHVRDYAGSVAHARERIEQYQQYLARIERALGRKAHVAKG